MSSTYWDIHSGGLVLSTKVVRGNRATIAAVTLNHGEYGVDLQTFGEALLHPEDKRNPEIGDLLALARAYEALGRRLRKRAEGLVKHQDDVMRSASE